MSLEGRRFLQDRQGEHNDCQRLEICVFIYRRETYSLQVAVWLSSLPFLIIFIIILLRYSNIRLPPPSQTLYCPHFGPQFLATGPFPSEACVVLEEHACLPVNGLRPDSRPAVVPQTQ